MREEMREVLSARDELAGTEPGSLERARLCRTLDGFAEVAEQRCAELHEQLHAAESAPCSARMRHELTYPGCRATSASRDPAGTSPDASGRRRRSISSSAFSNTRRRVPLTSSKNVRFTVSS